MRIHRDERGQTIILVALSLPLLLAFVGIAVDVGALFKDKRTLQTAADAAAMAAALNLSGNYTQAATAAATANGYTNAANGVTVTVNDPPTWPGSNYLSSGGTANGYVEVTITKTESTIFLALFGYPSVNVLARAVATNTGPGVCMLTGLGSVPLLTTPLVVSGTVLARQCGVVVNTANSPPMAVSGSLSATSIGAVGSCGSGNSSCQNSSPTPASGIIPYTDPFAALAQPTCAGGANLIINGGTQVLPAGCYNSLTASGTYTITLSGAYLFSGPVSLSGNGTITGTGVTLFMTPGGSLTVNSPVVMNLTAPNTTSSTYNGILFAQGSTNPNPATIEISPTSTLQGIFYFPDASLTINTTGTTPTLYIDLFANALTVNAAGTLNLQDYATAPGVTSPITSAVIVE